MAILLLRGHIRNSFDDDDLYSLVKDISQLAPIEIYISTWNVYANNLSWRQVKEDSRIVTEEAIYDYFKDLKSNIKHIMIEDDTKINLVGRVTGTMGGGTMPIKGWKNMWYGNYNIMDHIKKNNDSENMVINTRLDILKNSNREIYTRERVFTLISNCIHHFYINRVTINKNIFAFNHEWAGIDNIFIGNVKTMHHLIYHFNFNLDAILSHYESDFKCPHELLVFRENELLFG